MLMALANKLPLKKRIFDLTIVMITAPLWVPTLVLTALAVFITSGWPIIYLSRRYVLRDTYRTIIKFRAMVKNAEAIANRETIAPEPDRMLNIVIQSELYTPLGKVLERTHLTEIPQLLQVLIGTLTLVGNRPMPENMLELARQTYPYLEERFTIPSGITGPAQVVGRDRLSDQERLNLEITYAYICRHAYSPLLDLTLLLITVLTPFGAYRNLNYADMQHFLFTYVSAEKINLITNSNIKKI